MEAFDAAVDIMPLILLVVAATVVISMTAQISSSNSTSSSSRYPSKRQTKSKPLLRPLARWLYDRTLGFVIGRKRYHYRTWGTAPFVSETSDDINTCVHCDESGDGLSIAYGRERVALGFVIWRAREGTVNVCQSCEVKQRQEVATI